MCEHERKERCETCKWHVQVDDEAGWCHRYPPTVKNPDDGEDDHPLTATNDFCGEWTSNPKPPVMVEITCPVTKRVHSQNVLEIQLIELREKSLHVIFLKNGTFLLADMNAITDIIRQAGDHCPMIQDQRGPHMALYSDPAELAQFAQSLLTLPQDLFKNEPAQSV